jgi:hypothetical protein
MSPLSTQIMPMIVKVQSFPNLGILSKIGNREPFLFVNISHRLCPIPYIKNFTGKEIPSRLHERPWGRRAPIPKLGTIPFLVDSKSGYSWPRT